MQKSRTEQEGVTAGTWSPGDKNWLLWLPCNSHPAQLGSWGRRCWPGRCRRRPLAALSQSSHLLCPKTTYRGYVGPKNTSKLYHPHTLSWHMSLSKQKLHTDTFQHIHTVKTYLWHLGKLPCPGVPDMTHVQDFHFLEDTEKDISKLWLHIKKYYNFIQGVLKKMNQIWIHWEMLGISGNVYGNIQFQLWHLNR